MRSLVFFFVLSFFSPPLNYAQSDFSKLEKSEGYFPYYYDENSGKIWLEIEEFNTDFLYVNSLSQGVGSNDIGLDRGQLGGERVVQSHPA